MNIEQIMQHVSKIIIHYYYNYGVLVITPTFFSSYSMVVRS